MSKSELPREAKAAEDTEEDQDLKKKEERTKARLRSRGPYRKSHADW